MRGRAPQNAVSQAERVVGQYIGDGVTIPTPLFTAGIAFIFGIIVSDAVLTSTELGKKRLARLVEERLGGKR